MSTAQWVILVLFLVVIAGLALIPPLFPPPAILVGIAVVILLYRIGNSLQAGFNEHIKAMQAIYEEIVRQNRAVKPSGDSPEPRLNQVDRRQFGRPQMRGSRFAPEVGQR